jgi:hypothetical protein
MTVTGWEIAAFCSVAAFWLENSARSSAAAAAEIHDASRQSFGMASHVCGGEVGALGSREPTSAPAAE